MIKPQPPVETF